MTGRSFIAVMDAECAARLGAPSGARRLRLPRQLALVADGSPRIVTWMVDGVLCDGGPAAAQGFSWWPPTLGALGAPGSGVVVSVDGRGSYAGQVHSVRYYTRALRTSELVSSFRAGGVVVPMMAATVAVATTVLHV